MYGDQINFSRGAKIAFRAMFLVAALLLAAAPAGAKDKKAPSKPGKASAYNTYETALHLKWKKSSDNKGVDKYLIYRDGQRKATVSKPKGSLKSLKCGKKYSIYVVSYDSAGNKTRGPSTKIGTSPCPQPAPPAPAPPAAPAPASDTTPPSVPDDLVSAGVGRHVMVVAWDTAIDNSGGPVTYDVYRDGTKVRTTSNTWAGVGGLDCDTDYHLTVTARDTSGNSASTAPLTVTTAFCEDIDPPSAPANLETSNTTLTTTDLDWDNSTDNVGVVRYAVTADGRPAGNTTDTFMTVDKLNCGNPHSLVVIAFDAAGNAAASLPQTVTTDTCSDNSPPSAVTVTPSPSGPNSVALSWNASSDNVGIAGYDVLQNGDVIAQLSPVDLSYNVNDLTCNHGYFFTVVARDTSENRTPSAPESTVTQSCDNVGPSGIPMPEGDLPGWHQIFADNFTKDAATGSFASECDPDRIVYTGATGTEWRAYPECYTDTYDDRPYRSDAVLSVHDGTLDFYLHNVDGVPAGANPSPVLNNGTGSQYQTYGRYDARVKVDDTDLSEYYMAWLVWPQDEASWASAESDYPEGSLNDGKQGVSGFHHYGHGLQEAFGDPSIDMHQWHTYTQEWSPGVRRYYVDGKLVYATGQPVYSGPERWQLQTETNGNGNHAGHLLVDWVSVYSYAP